MDWLIVIGLLAIGLGLIMLELIFIPGTTFVGLLGLASAGYGVYLSYAYFGSTVGSAVLFVAGVLALIGVYAGLKSGAWEQFSLKETISSKVNEELSLPSVGAKGKAISALRPYGTCEFEGALREAQSFEGFIDAGKKVRVIKVENSKIIVEEDV
jgi:membrane-bound ClpP family serine protease